MLVRISEQLKTGLYLDIGIRIFLMAMRNFGYGGFNYDGRWKKVAKKIIDEYKLKNNSSFLQLNCEKGFLLNDVKDALPESEVIGFETSEYAVSTAMEKVKKNIKKVDNYFNLGLTR